MDRDFHYYGTYLAAYAAGFSNKEAKVIATSAQYIDDCTEDKTHVTSYKGLRAVEKSFKVKMSEDEVLDWHPMMTSVYDMKTWAPTSNYDETRKIWMPFHFLPGNQREQLGVNNAVVIRNENTDQSSMGGWQVDPRFDTFSSRTANNDSMLCRPRSMAAQNMIEFARQNFQSYQTLNDTLGLNMLGSVMHVFADTYAHQDFTGVSDKRTNGVRNNIVSNPGKFTNIGTWDQGVWTPNLNTLKDISWAWNIASDDDPLTIHSGPPSTTGALGHGQMGHLNDVSTIYMAYQPNWQARGIQGFSHNNPTEFFCAFQDMVKAMWCVRHNQAFSWANLPDLPESCTQEILNAVMQLIAPDDKADIDTSLYEKGLFVPGRDWFGASEDRWNNALVKLCGKTEQDKAVLQTPGYNEAAGWKAQMELVASEEIPKSTFVDLKFVNWNIATKGLFKQNYRYLRYTDQGHGRVVRLRELGSAMNLLTNVSDDVNRFFGANDSVVNAALDVATNTDMVDKILDKGDRVNFADVVLKYGDLVTLKSGTEYLTNCSQNWVKVSYVGRATTSRDEAQAVTLYSLGNNGRLNNGGLIGTAIKHNDVVLIQTKENTVGSYQFLGRCSAVFGPKVSYYSLYDVPTYDSEDERGDAAPKNEKYVKFFKTRWDDKTPDEFIPNNIRWKVIASDAQDIKTSSTVTFQNVADTSKYLVFKNGQLDLDSTAGNFNLAGYFMNPA